MTVTQDQGSLGNQHELLTLTEAADLIRTPPATLRYWRHLGSGPRSFRLGRRAVYRRTELLQWIKSQESAGIGTPTYGGVGSCD
jgi:predicted DNA-binding transcriptional regulator AlpA